MSILEDSDRILQTAVLKDNKPYTYKLLSRHLDIHVNDAKKLLYTFYKNHKDLVEATFLISGTLEGKDDLKIKVTKDLKDREKFDQVQSIQVYSLSPRNIKIDEIVSTVNAQLQEYKVDETKLAKWGLIKGPELVKIESVTKKEAPKATTTTTVKKAEAKTGTSVAPSKKKEFPDMGLRSAQILNKNRKKEDEKPKARTSTQPTFGSSSKQANPTTSRAKTDPITKSRDDKSGLNDDEYAKKQKALNAEKDKKQKELESMFDDDEDDDDVVMGEVVEKDNEGIETTTTVSKKNEDLEGIFDSSFSQTQSQSNKNDVEKEPISEEPEVIGNEDVESQEPKVEQKEEVTSYYDEDGYLVTKVAEKSKAKSKPKSKARASPAPSSVPAAKKAKTTANPGSKQQSSLMSFFGKK